jgi:hypothetical protein
MMVLVVLDGVSGLRYNNERLRWEHLLLLHTPIKGLKAISFLKRG